MWIVPFGGGEGKTSSNCCLETSIFVGWHSSIAVLLSNALTLYNSSALKLSALRVVGSMVLTRSANMPTVSVDAILRLIGRSLLTSTPGRCTKILYVAMLVCGRVQVVLCLACKR